MSRDDSRAEPPPVLRGRGGRRRGRAEDRDGLRDPEVQVEEGSVLGATAAIEPQGAGTK